jgi:hypothetical protein
MSSETSEKFSAIARHRIQRKETENCKIKLLHYKSENGNHETRNKKFNIIYLITFNEVKASYKQLLMFLVLQENTLRYLLTP